MESTREDIRYQHPFLAVRIFDAERSARSNPIIGQWHYHKEVEIIVMLKGRYGFLINETPTILEKDDVHLIASNELHTDYPCDNGTYLVLQFDIHEHLEHSGLPYYRYFSDTGSSLSRLNDILRERTDARDAIARSVKNIYQESQARKDGYEIAISIQIKQIILTLLRADTQKMIPVHDNMEVQRLKPVLDHIELHLGDKLQVEDACRLVNMSYHYFVKYFKKTMGISFVDYITFKKIKRAERLLLTKDISVAQIGEEVGMSNMAHFYKMFRKFKDCSPNEFRKKMLYEVGSRSAL